jgi:signal transduction histidine kinase
MFMTTAPARPPRFWLWAVALPSTAIAIGLTLHRWPQHAEVIGPVGLAVVLGELMIARGATQHSTSSFGEASLTLGRRLVGLMLLVLAGFAATLAYAFSHLAPIQGSVDSLVLNALPSAGALSEARSAITDLEIAVPAMILSDLTPGSAKRTEVEAARRRLDAALAAEQETPTLPGEEVQALAVRRALAALDAQTAEAISSPGKEPLEMRVQRTTAWLAASQRADRAVTHQEVYNLEHATREAHSILESRRRAAQIAAAMFLATLLAATAATVTTIRLMRVQGHEAAIRERFLVNRAEELEEFAARIAYDLRVPLGALSIRLGAVRSNVGTEAPLLGAALDNAVLQIDRMDGLLGALLDFARSGGKPPTGARAELRDVVERVVEELTPAAKSAHTELRVAPFRSEQLACTPGALSSVLANLVGNAVKYVVEGHQLAREVHVRVEDRDQAVRVEVADTGPGLPRGVEEIVFQPLVKLGSSRFPGTGLGLATAKRIVESYGGSIGVRSAPGAGSCFWFEMPKAQGA